MQERRKLKRFRLRLPSKVEAEPRPPDEASRVQELETENICSGGAFFRTLTPLMLGTRVKIEMVLELFGRRYPLSSVSLVRVKGEVLRSEATGMAVRFDKPHAILPRVV
jgi:hypothetical protein